MKPKEEIIEEASKSKIPNNSKKRDDNSTNLTGKKSKNKTK